jgi:hypothetical protein
MGLIACFALFFFFADIGRGEGETMVAPVV